MGARNPTEMGNFGGHPCDAAFHHNSLTTCYSLGNLYRLIKMHSGLDCQQCDSPGGSAGEEHDAFEFAIVEEIVERPDAAFLAVRVRRQVWVVAASYNKHHCHHVL